MDPLITHPPVNIRTVFNSEDNVEELFPTEVQSKATTNNTTPRINPNTLAADYRASEVKKNINKQTPEEKKYVQALENFQENLECLANPYVLPDILDQLKKYETIRRDIWQALCKMKKDKQVVILDLDDEIARDDLRVFSFESCTCL